MFRNETLRWAQELQSGIAHAISAHSEHGKSPNDAIRFHDRKTPYAVHPIWCATTLLAEPALDDNTRRVGYLALLWHDTLEDTNLPLPNSADRQVKDLVEQMTFASFDQETRDLWKRPPLVKLLKLYDKVSNLLDGTHMKDEKWNRYVDHTLRLMAEVVDVYGCDLNIVRIAGAIATRR
jgi:hypothetical protein